MLNIIKQYFLILIIIVDRVAGAGFAPASRAYETRVVLLHHPAIILIIYIISKYQNSITQSQNNKIFLDNMLK